MQKISYELLDIILEKCSKKEIDFILYCAQFQNDFGNVRDINYKIACLNIQITKQCFYKIIKSLEEKGIILVNWENSRDWSFTFVNNQFIEYKNYRKGYLKTNFWFLHSNEFKNYDLRTKRLFLKLLKVYRRESNFKIGVDKLLQWADVKNEIELEKYIEILKEYFNISEYKGMFKIKLKKYTQGAKDLEQYKFLFHRITSFCSKYKVSYTVNSLKELYFIFVDRRSKDKYNKIVMAICDTVFRYKSIEPGLIKSIVKI